MPVRVPVSLSDSFSQKPKRALASCDTTSTPSTNASMPAMTPAIGAAAPEIAVPAVAVDAACSVAAAACPADVAIACSALALAAAWLFATAFAAFAFDTLELAAEACVSCAPIDFVDAVRRMRDTIRLAEIDLSRTLPIPSNSGVSSSSSTAASSAMSAMPVLNTPAEVGEGLPPVFEDGRPTPSASVSASSVFSREFAAPGCPDAVDGARLPLAAELCLPSADAGFVAGESTPVCSVAAEEAVERVDLDWLSASFTTPPFTTSARSADTTSDMLSSRYVVFDPLTDGSLRCSPRTLRGA